jgi:hypothetical protein
MKPEIAKMRKMYHGTDLDGLIGILKDGYIRRLFKRPNMPTEPDDWVFVTPSKKFASQFPFVLTIHLPFGGVRKITHYSYLNTEEPELAVKSDIPIHRIVKIEFGTYLGDKKIEIPKASEMFIKTHIRLLQSK